MEISSIDKKMLESLRTKAQLTDRDLEKSTRSFQQDLVQQQSKSRSFVRSSFGNHLYINCINVSLCTCVVASKRILKYNSRGGGMRDWDLGWWGQLVHVAASEHCKTIVDWAGG